MLGSSKKIISCDVKYAPDSSRAMRFDATVTLLLPPSFQNKKTKQNATQATVEDMIRTIVVANMLPSRDDYALYVGPEGDGAGEEKKERALFCLGGGFARTYIGVCVSG